MVLCIFWEYFGHFGYSLGILLASFGCPLWTWIIVDLRLSKCLLTILHQTMTPRSSEDAIRLRQQYFLFNLSSCSLERKKQLFGQDLAFGYELCSLHMNRFGSNDSIFQFCAHRSAEEEEWDWRQGNSPPAPPSRMATHLTSLHYTISRGLVAPPWCGGRRKDAGGMVVVLTSGWVAVRPGLGGSSGSPLAGAGAPEAEAASDPTADAARPTSYTAGGG